MRRLSKPAAENVISKLAKMPQEQSERVIYEQPLNERMRAFMRLEHLFRRGHSTFETADEWSSREALEVLVNLQSLVGRTELKKELIKELDRQGANLDALSANPRVDSRVLAKTLGRVRTASTALRDSPHMLGQELKQHELLNTFKQRSGIPAGTCDFDLPSLHFWLQRPAKTRLNDLKEWLSYFDVVGESVALCLGLVRDSATATKESASKGFFQKDLEASTPFQMVRIAMPQQIRLFPEISAGRHRFTVRFMGQESVEQRPAQTEADVQFELLCCMM